MTFEAFILGCGILTYAQANHIRDNWQQYDNRAVACAIIRWKEEQPKPVPLKTLRDVPALDRKTP